MTVVPAFVGRATERARLEALLSSAIRGHGGAVVVSGAPGSGRTRLLDETTAQARVGGFDVRQARGRRSERHIDGAVARELFELTDLAPIPLLDHLQGLSATAPLLVAVDDLHDADRTSIELLTFAARRVLRHPIVLLFAGAFDGTPQEELVADLERMSLDGLLDDEIAALFTLVAGPLEHRLVEVVRERSGGNPLAVIELARLSSAAQRHGDEPFGDLPAVSATVVRAFARPMEDLSDATRRALCVAAAEPTGHVDVIARALAALGESIEALEPAELAGLVHLTDGVVRFDHPMRRVVAYAALAAPSRRAAHRALAAAHDGAGAAEARLAHLSAGTVGHDEQLAADLVTLADRLERTGRPADAADACRRAASHTADTTRRDALVQKERRLRAASDGPARTASARLDVLTNAERRVARVVAEGLSNRETAARLHLSLKTVDAHLQSIYRKLQVGNRASLAVMVTLHDAEVAR